jgi:hypothetical protein
MSNNDKTKLVPRSWIVGGSIVAAALAVLGIVLPEHYNALELVLSFLLTWTIYLAPPLVIRLANKEPFSAWSAVGLCVVLWFVYHIIFVYLGSDGKIGSAVLGILAAYYILRRGAQSENNPSQHLVKPTDVSENKSDADRGWGKK